jgi:hypothetical protein
MKPRDQFYASYTNRGAFETGLSSTTSVKKSSNGQGYGSFDECMAALQKRVPTFGPPTGHPEPGSGAPGEIIGYIMKIVAVLEAMPPVRPITKVTELNDDYPEVGND